MRTIKKILLGLLVVLALLIIGFVIWGSTPSKPMSEALAALESTTTVKVKQDGWIEFAPVGSTPTTGFIIYPGGRVDYRAYAPTAQAIAEKGYLVIILPMPLNLAVLNPNAAEKVIAAYPDIQNWVVGGHSLGGAMAANFAYKNPSLVSGLILWAAYPASSNNLSSTDLDVLSIYGTADGLSTGDKIDASRQLLPENTTWFPIEGGNHGQFGWYGIQPGDNPALITREEQQAQIVQATVQFLEQLQ
jgi:pimeloyl-ACP methyl ester carboxylesterase